MSTFLGQPQVARWGGEEFVVLLPQSDAESLKEVAERLRMLVQNSWVNEDKQNIRVTISLDGTNVRTGEDAEAALGRADERVYASKENGRNQATFA